MLKGMIEHEFLQVSLDKSEHDEKFSISQSEIQNRLLVWGNDGSELWNILLTLGHLNVIDCD